MKVVLRFCPDGRVCCLHTELIDLRELGRLTVVRATLVEFNDPAQQWEVRHAGTRKLLHADPSREACLRWEREHLVPGPHGPVVALPLCLTNDPLTAVTPTPPARPLIPTRVNSSHHHHHHNNHHQS